MSTTEIVVRIDDPSSFRAVQAVIWYIDNRPFSTFWREVFHKDVPPAEDDKSHDAGYAAGWRDNYARGLGVVWGRLDRAHRNRLIAAALAHYAADIDADIVRINGADPCEGCGAPSVRETDCGGGVTRWCAECYAKGLCSCGHPAHSGNCTYHGPDDGVPCDCVQED